MPLRDGTNLIDPWAVPVAAGGERPLDRRLRSLAVVLLGAGGPCAAIWQDGPSQRRAAAALFALTAIWCLSIRLLRPTGAAVAAVFAVAVAAFPLVNGTIGRAPMLITLLGTLVADAALFRDAPRPLDLVPPRRTRRSGPTATLALAPLVSAEVVWARDHAVLPFVVLAGVAAIVVVAYGAIPSVVDPVDGAVRRAILAVTSAFSLVAVGIVAFPLLYLPGLLSRLGGRVRHPSRRWDDGRTRWVSREVAVAQHRQDARNMFASAEPRVRLRRNRFALVLLVALATTTVVARYGGADAPADRSTATPPAGTPFSSEDKAPYIESEAYKGNPVAAVIQRDQGEVHLVPNAIGGTRVDDVATETFNVEDGERRTYRPTCTCPRLTVWFMGGSAAFGIGQRDQHTIASELARRAEEEGIGLDIRNFGTPAWTIWQEYQALTARLAMGDGAAPDLVVFYDGFNDVAGTLIETVLRGVDPHTPTLLADADVWEIARSGRRLDVPGGGAEVGRLAAAKYSEIRQLAIETAARHGARAEFVEQPDALTSPVQVAAARRTFGSELTIMDRIEMPAALDAYETALRGDVLDLRQLFTDDDAVAFLDAVHQPEDAAARVADSIFEGLRPTIDDLVSNRQR